MVSTSSITEREVDSEVGSEVESEADTMTTPTSHMDAAAEADIEVVSALNTHEVAP